MRSPRAPAADLRVAAVENRRALLRQRFRTRPRREKVPAHGVAREEGVVAFQWRQRGPADLGVIETETFAESLTR